MFLKRLFAFIPKDEFSKALNLFNSGEYRKALGRFQEIRAVAGQAGDIDRATLDLYTCESHVALAKECDEAGDVDGAVREMEAAVTIKPMFADLHYKLGALYVRTDRLEDAGNCFRNSLDINNKFFRSRIYLSKVLRELGDKDGAIREVVSSKLSCPNFYRESLDALVVALRTNNAEEVARLFSEMIEERPSSAQISKELAVEAIQNGNMDEAIRELKKALAIKPDYPDLHNYLGIAYGNSGMVDDAVYEFEVALKINPYYAKARLNLALLYYENTRFEEAQAQIDHVLKVQPDNQLANNLLNELRVVTSGRLGK
jgi:tetratricopeptide (TPR) repeat protein